MDNQKLSHVLELLRFEGSDNQLSEQEQELFISARGPSLYDEVPIPETNISELNNEIKNAYITQ